MTTSDDSRADASAVDALVARAVRQRGIGRYTRHLLLCTGPDCAPAETALESWEYLKRRLRELDLVAPAGPVYRSKVGCLQVCADGPIAVVYPDGTWYRRCTPEAIERILQQHVIGGHPVEELVFARNPLAAPPAPDGAP